MPGLGHPRYRFRDILRPNPKTVQITFSELAVTRGDTGSYTVSLASQPTEAVLVELQASGGVRLDMLACEGGEAGVCLIFNAENWNLAQAVTVRASAAGQVTHEVISGDDGYDGMDAPAVDVGLTAGGNDVFLPLVNK